MQSFIDNGIVVVSGVFDSDEVSKIRNGFHNTLKRKGCDVDDLENTAGALSKLSSTGGAGGVLDIFYEDWKLALNENEKIFSIITQLWKETYASSTTVNFEHPFGAFDYKKAYMYIDRVCFRVPDSISLKFAKGSNKKKPLQRSLTPHLDVCPHKLYSKEDGMNKWKPIQCFIALTDTIESDTGGFEACPGFHQQFDEWTRNRKPSSTTATTTSTAPSLSSASSNKNDGNSIHGGDNHQESSSLHQPPCVGSFTPIRPVEDADVIQQFRHIPCRAGDLILWDYRIPHANARYNHSEFSREVVYLGFLPAIDINKKYAQQHLERLRNNQPPSDQWHSSKNEEKCTYDFSPLGQKLLGIDEWNDGTATTSRHDTSLQST